MRPDNERDLEKELRDLGSRIEYPSTPDLARSVRRRLEQGDAERARGWLAYPPPWWTAAAAMLVLVLAVPIFSPAARDTLSGLLPAGGAAGGGAQSASNDEADQDAPSGGPAATEGAASREYSRPETGVPQASSSGMPEEDAVGGPLPSSGGSEAASIAASLGLGERISLREARARGAGPILLPQFGEPEGVYAVGPPREGGVGLVYSARPGLPPLAGTEAGVVLTELPGDVESAYPEEFRRSPEEVRVGGERGYWLPDGRLGAGALIWQRDGRALRLEADLPKGEVVRIASSARKR